MVLLAPFHIRRSSGEVPRIEPISLRTGHSFPVVDTGMTQRYDAAEGSDREPSRGWPGPPRESPPHPPPGEVSAS